MTENKQMADTKYCTVICDDNFSVHIIIKRDVEIFKNAINTIVIISTHSSILLECIYAGIFLIYTALSKTCVVNNVHLNK